MHLLLYPPLKKRGSLCYTFRSKICVECPSVTISFQLSILSTLQPILFKFYIRVDIGEEKLEIIDGIIDGSVCQISTEILPFMLKIGFGALSCQISTEILPFMLKIGFGALSWPIISLIFFKVDIRIWGVMGLQITYFFQKNLPRYGP